MPSAAGNSRVLGLRRAGRATRRGVARAARKQPLRFESGASGDPSFKGGMAGWRHLAICKALAHGIVEAARVKAMALGAACGGKGAKGGRPWRTHKSGAGGSSFPLEHTAAPERVGKPKVFQAPAIGAHGKRDALSVCSGAVPQALDLAMSAGDFGSKITGHFLGSSGCQAS